MSKTALMLLVILALSSIVISGQGQEDQSIASTTTTTENALGPTTTATTTDMTLYEGGSLIFPIGAPIGGISIPPIGPSIAKAHIKIAKHSDVKSNEYIYTITIENAGKLTGEDVAFIPKDIVALFSVDDNVYIKYDDRGFLFTRV
jgi:hypothetical protein